MNERTIWFSRHGNRLDFISAEWLATAERPYDSPLSPDGVIQARELGRRLAREKIDHLFSSPFLRALETAAQVAEVIDRPIRIEAGLCEMFLPQWFPVPPTFSDPAEMARRFPRVDPTYQSAVQPKYPETREDMLARTARTVQELARNFPGNLSLVGHGGSMGGLCAGLVGGNPTVHPALCCLVKVAGRNGGWILEADGSDTSHLSQVEQPLRLA